MKKILSILGVIVSLGLNAQTTTDGSITHNGGTRTYKIYVPASYDGSEDVPLVLNLHGLGSNNNEQLLYGDFRPIADTANFIILLPQGLPNQFNQQNHWNANFGTGVQDIDFLSKLIDSIAADYSIDLDRVYSTGMSNGGYMSITLAGQLSDKITAVASVTGTMTGLQIPANTVSRPMPVMQIHGDADPVVTYNGSVNPLGSSISVDSLLNYWIEHNNCSTTAVVTPVTDVNTTDGCTATRYDYLNGENGAEVVHYKITGGGHTWPGAFALSGKVTNQDFDASTEIWKFFSKYTKTALVSVKEIIAENNWIKINSENPSSGIIKLMASNTELYSISVFNLEGRLIETQLNNSGEATLNLSNFSNGNYLIKAFSENKEAVLRVVKQ